VGLLDIVQGEARVVLVDLRHDSPTVGRCQSVMLGENAPTLGGHRRWWRMDISACPCVTVILTTTFTSHTARKIPTKGGSPGTIPGSASDWTIENI